MNDMSFNYFELLKKIKRIPLIIKIVVPIIILLFLWLIQIITGITGAKYADSVSIVINGLGIDEIKSIQLYRYTPNNNLSLIKTPRESNTWIINGKYFKKIYIESSSAIINNIKEIKIQVGIKNYVYTNKDIKLKWVHNENETNNDYYIISPDELTIKPSFLIKFSNKFSSLINYPDEKKMLFDTLIKSILSIIFLPFVLVILYISFNFIDKLLAKIKATNNFSFLLLFLVIIFSLMFINTKGIHDVSNSWLDGWWMNSYEKYGFIKGYTDAGDNYPPLSFVIIGLVKEFSKLLHFEKLLIYKLFILIFLISTTIVFYACTKNIILSCLLHVSLIIGSVAHGYMDIFFVPFLILSLFMLQKNRYVAFVILYAIASLMKYQPLIILPFILLYIIKINKLDDLKKIDYKNTLLKVILPACIIFFINLFIFGPHLVSSLFKGMQHNGLSANALNFNWILTFILHLLNPIKYGYIGSEINVIENVGIISILSKVIFIFLFMFALFRFFKDDNKSFDKLLAYSITGYLTYFMFNVGVHHNHLIVVLVLFSILIFLKKDYINYGIFWMLFFNLNLILFYGFTGEDTSLFRIIFNTDIITILLSVIGLIIYFFFYIKSLKSE